ncbi:MoxR family ATPase [Pontibacter sp. G13]|uniref:AAA family ATPase n=1 Tax=Pontibacter sp. G13 TaxID=3074898 RepID=UPI00288BC653|nr:MoxR family ATPase [Pontibacter sp. G13]WNJ21374.1 MoxR family ATPase [Pontibacter sp. G13]
MEEQQLFETDAQLLAFRDSVDRIKAEIGLFIVGQHQMVELMIAALLSNGHILVEGVPGVAKTMASKLLGKTLNIGFSRIQFTPDLMPSDVLGTSVFNNQSGKFEFHQGPIFSQIVLIDEINRAPAKTQAALFEAMEERQVTIDGNTYPMQPPFIVISTQNPIEQEGTYRLPEAQLDRFLFKIEVGYPTLEEETRILTEFHERNGLNDLNAIQPVLTAEKILELQEIVRQLHIDSNLIEYIVKIVHATRNSQDIYMGASPRASINIMTASKAIAAIRGRSFVTPEDIQYVTPSVLHHRIILTPEREMEGATAHTVVQQLVEGIEVPR